MSSIPLPALNVRPVQIPNPMEQYGQMLQLRSLLGQQQLQQQSLLDAQQQNQARGLQLKDAQTLRQLAPRFVQKDSDGNAKGFDYQGYLNAATQAGVNPQTLLSLRNGLIESQQKMLGLSKDQLDMQAQLNQGAYQRLETIRGITDPGKRQAAYQQAMSWAQQNGADVAQFPSQAPDNESLTGLETSLGVHAQMIADAQKQAETAASQAAVPGAQAKSTADQLSLIGQTLGPARNQQQWASRLAFLRAQGLGANLLGQIPQQFSPEAANQARQLAITPQQQAQQPVDKLAMSDWLNKNPGKGPADYEKYLKTLVPAFNFNLQSAGGLNAISPQQAQLSGPAFLKTVTPADSGTIQALASGRMKLPSSFALRTPYWQRLLAELNQYDPGFSEQRAQIRKAFTSGPDGKNIGSLNTAAVHLDTLGEAAQALANGQFTPGNAAFNALKTVFGGSAPTTFEGLRNAVSGEMANALKGNATDQEIANISKAIGNQNSPQQLSDWINANLHIISQKLNTYKERYEQQIPNDTLYSPVLPSAQQVFAKHGIGSGSAQSQEKAGAQTSLKEGMTGTGSDGKKYIVKGGVWVAQ